MKRVITIFILSLSIVSFASNPIKSRRAQLDKILAVTAQQFCNPHYLKTTQWQQFLETVKSDEVLSLSEPEFVKAFNKAAESLPFTHYYLRYTKKNKRSANATPVLPAFSLEASSPETAILTVRSWAADAEGMMAIVGQIEQEGFKNLIIDLRDNRGGTLDAAVVLGQYLTQEPIRIGTFITKNWFDANADFPNAEQREQFPYLRDMTYQGFGAMLNQPAFKLEVPAHNNPTFTGEVFVLTNSLTASTCEPLVNVMKKQNLGTVIGQPTAGAMMSANYVKIDKRIKLFIPHADFVDADGQRIDKVGVTPDILVPASEALNTALEMLK
ncbi:MAG: S41 family peptidase [Gilvibacter sp.]